jgi:fibronectin type 3 domain-containing protein
LGVLVLCENRRFGTNAEPLGQLSRMIRRDRNHPAIFAWSLCNEEVNWQGSAGGATLIQVMQDLTHSLDPWRKCTAAVNFSWNSGFATVIDVQGLNYEKYGNLDTFHRDAPALPAMGTENGSTTTSRGKYYMDVPNGYIPGYDIVYQSISGAFAANWAQTAEKWSSRYPTRPWIGGGFVWTGFDYRGEPIPFGWPCVSSAYAVMDTCGFFKDTAHYYEANWTVKPKLHLFPHWNWAPGTNVNVWVFGNCDSVELFTNSVSLGRKLLNTQNHLEWNVPWTSGTLKAVGYSHLMPIITNMWTTSWTPTAIALRPDRSTILADGRDVSVITVAALDAQGNVVPTASNTVSFSVSGGTIIGVGDGDPASHESDKGTQRSLFNGLAQVIVQSTNVPGSITLTASSSGLPTTNVTIIETTSAQPPTAPMGVVAIPGNARITVGWDIVPGAVSYNLSRSTQSGGPYTVVAGNIGAVNLGFTDASVTNGTTYYYVVTANGNGTSTNSAQVSATPVPMVSDLTAVSTNGAIQLNWSGSTGVNYNIKRSSTCGGPYTNIAASISGTNYIDWMVSAAQTNYYIVTITNAGGESIPSNEAGASVGNVPWPWISMDVGAVNLDGSASYNSGQFTVSGSGRGIPDSQATGLDFFQFVYVQIPNTTNGYIQARVASVQNTASNAKAGVMIRENLYADSRFAMVDVQPTAGIEFVRRTSTGGAGSTSTLAGSAPRWVRLTRTNNTFRAFSSTDGNTWTAVGTATTFTMNNNAYVGLIVCSQDNGKLNTSALDNVGATFFPANSAPALNAMPNQAVNVGQTAASSANAADSSSPTPVLTFTLLNAPTNATLVKVSSTNAAFNWRPWVNNADTTNLITLKVADNAIPSLSATQSFFVTVNPLTRPSISASAWNNGQFSAMVSGQAGPDYAVQASTNLMDWSTIWTTNSPPVPFSWLDPNTSAFPLRFYRIAVGPPF